MSGGAPPRGVHRGTPGEAVPVWTGHVPAGRARLARFLVTDRAVGDLAVDGDRAELQVRRRAVLDRPWVWLRQVHGAHVVVVGADDDPPEVSGAEADALVTRRSDIALAVQIADCAPIALVGRAADGDPDRAVLGAVHAGWKGLEAGVLAAAVTEMVALGADEVVAALGPCIGPECYAFGAEDLDRLAARFGSSVRAETHDGRSALDLRAGVRVALAEVSVEVVCSDPRCTACAGGDHPSLYSHRARADTGRQAMVVWLEEQS